MMNDDYEPYDQYMKRMYRATSTQDSFLDPRTTKWPIRFMNMAKMVSTWSKDPSSKIGAVAVNDERNILATGYNGFPKGIADTDDRLNNRAEKYPRIVHAEMNALMNALYNGVSLKGATLYVYGLPVCSDCTKCVIQAGVKSLWIMLPSDSTPETWTDMWNKQSRPMLLEAGVVINGLKEEELL